MNTAGLKKYARGQDYRPDFFQGVPSENRTRSYAQSAQLATHNTGPTPPHERIGERMFDLKTGEICDCIFHTGWLSDYANRNRVESENEFSLITWNLLE